MSIITRTFTSIFSKVDRVVGEIENHDALIRAAIQEQRKKLRRPRWISRRMNSNAKKVETQIKQLEAHYRSLG